MNKKSNIKYGAGDKMMRYGAFLTDFRVHINPPCLSGGIRSNNQGTRNSSSCSNNWSWPGDSMQGYLIWRYMRLQLWKRSTTVAKERYNPLTYEMFKNKKRFHVGDIWCNQQHDGIRSRWWAELSAARTITLRFTGGVLSLVKHAFQHGSDGTCTALHGAARHKMQIHGFLGGRAKLSLMICWIELLQHLLMWRVSSP
jgi:hypothetical protein